MIWLWILLYWAAGIGITLWWETRNWREITVGDVALAAVFFGWVWPILLLAYWWVELLMNRIWDKPVWRRKQEDHNG